MQEEFVKRQCVREPPSCWIPASARSVPVVAAAPAAVVAPPTALAQPFAAFVPSAPPLSPTSIETIRRMKAAQLRATKYRDPRFPGAGLLREDGGVFGSMIDAVANGRSTWL